METTKEPGARKMRRDQELKETLADFFGVSIETFTFSAERTRRLSSEELDNIMAPRVGHEDFKFHAVVLIGRFGPQVIDESSVGLVEKYFQRTLSVDRLKLFEQLEDPKDVMRTPYHESFEDIFFSLVLRGKWSGPRSALLTLIGSVRPGAEEFLKKLNSLLWEREKKRQGSLTICEILFETLKDGVSHKDELQELLVRQLLELDTEFALEAWFIFAYLEQYQIVQHIIDHHRRISGVDDLGDKYLDFCHTPSFSFVSRDYLEANYEKFQMLQTVAKTKSLDHFRNGVREWGVFNLIANIAMARSKEDIEFELLCLRILCFRTPLAIGRISEVTGQMVPKSFIDPHDGGSAWVRKRQAVLSEYVGGSTSTRLKKHVFGPMLALFAVMPFDFTVLEVLIIAEVQRQTAMFRKMYQASIIRMKSPKGLSILTTASVKHENFFALGFILERLADLKLWTVFKDTIVFRLTKAGSYQTLPKAWIIGVRMMLETFYRKAPTEETSKLHRAIFNSGSNAVMAMFNRLLDEREKGKEFSIIVMRDIKGYDEMISLISNPKANLTAFELVRILEIMLAQRKQKSEHIVKAYRLLVKAEPSLASYFNQFVETHVARCNDGTVSVSHLYSGGSRVWNVPAVLENPVNKLASNLAGWNFKVYIADPEKRKT